MSSASTQQWQVLSQAPSVSSASMQSWQVIGQSPYGQYAQAEAPGAPQAPVFQQAQAKAAQPQAAPAFCAAYSKQAPPPFSSPPMQMQQQMPPMQMQQQMKPQMQLGFPQQKEVQKVSAPSAAGQTLFGHEDRKLGGLIVTLCEGNSYDPIFKEMAQSDDDGTVVAVYAVAMRSAEELGRALEAGRTEMTEMAELLKDLEAVSKDKVVFNWECCSGCNECGFPCCKGYNGFGFNGYGFGAPPAVQKLHNGQGGREINVKLAKLALDRGYMVMFADFSLKALITRWHEPLLGPNPFRQTGVVSGRIRLTFQPEVLKSCSSKQLVKVGELCTNGTAEINAMSSTIVYTVDDEAARKAEAANVYKLQRLTAAEGSVPGAATAGHVMLTYPSGGRLLTSAGHWKELSNLGGISEEGLLKVAEKRFGQVYSTSMRTSLEQAPTHQARQQMQQAFGGMCVQSYTPY